MNNDKHRLADLYNKYLSKDITEEQQREFFTYVENPLYNEFLKDLISDSYENTTVTGVLNENAKDRIFQTIVGNEKPKQIRLWPKIATVAASILIIAGMAIAYYSLDLINNQSNQIAHNDIAPGKFGATLTLSNGKKIKLDATQNGRLAEETGVVITKSENGELVYEIQGAIDGLDRTNTLSTSNGETYKIRLPDGSNVWLNSASSLTYASNLVKAGKRLVSLKGEAYFEVAKDKSHPFVVSTGKQTVEVLGTHFNINSYPDEPITSTTLLEGAVNVKSNHLSYLLKPGEQAVNNGENIKIYEVSTDNVIDWKNGDFNIDELDFRVAMRKIARWYDVDIVYQASVPQNIKSGGWISRNRNLHEVLKHIESSGQVNFKIVGKTLYVSK